MKQGDVVDWEVLHYSPPEVWPEIRVRIVAGL
jgi:hypothetical protein